jgi:phosphoribosyl-ATP pyrophosphohydrolase
LDRPNYDGGIIEHLWSVIMLRRATNHTTSYSSHLLAKGRLKVAEKFGEEAIECVASSSMDDRRELIYESADVLYHLIVLWISAGLTPSDVWAELFRREGTSGVLEKQMRSE